METLNRKDFEDYQKIGLRISSLRDRISKLEDMAARYEYGAVRGSNPDFPYQPMSFHVSGYNIREEERKRAKIRDLKLQLEKEIRKEEEKRLEIEEFINAITDRTDNLIFTYCYLEKMSQEEVARKLHIDQSRVSRRISKYLPEK